MRTSLLIFVMLFLQNLDAQIHPVKADSMEIVLVNCGCVKFARIDAVVRGHPLTATNIQPGDSVKFRLPEKGFDFFRFVVYLDKKLKQRYALEPEEYVEKVGAHKIRKGKYVYNLCVEQSAVKVRLHVMKE